MEDWKKVLASNYQHLPPGKPEPIQKKKPHYTGVMRIEKSGRGGKTVTVIDRLPRHPHYLEKLSRDLKTRCGSGGTWRIGENGGMVEIQGDKREMLRKIAGSMGITVKG